MTLCECGSIEVQPGQRHCYWCCPPESKNYTDTTMPEPTPPYARSIQLMTELRNCLHDELPPFKCTNYPSGKAIVELEFPDLDAAQAAHRVLGDIKQLPRPLPVRVPLTLEVWGDQYPIMANLREGFFLVAHPNGVAIACNDKGEAGFNYMGTLAHSNTDIPDSVRTRAIENLMAFARLCPTYPRVPKEGE